MQLLSTDQLRILDAISQGTVILKDGIIRHANTCFAAFCKTGQAGLPGHPFFDFVIPKHHRRVGRYLESIPADSSVCAAGKLEFTLRDIDGAESFMIMQAQAVAHDGVPALLCSLTDITQRTRAERKLKRILDSIPEVIIAFDRDHSRIESANHATEGLYGLPAEQFVQNIFHPIDLVFPEDADKVHAFYAGLVAREFDRIEYRIVHANGDIRWVRDEGEVVYKEQGLGRVQQVYHFIKDIADRKNDEERLRINEQKYRRIFENSTDPIFVADADGAFTDINQAAVALLGYASREEALAGSLDDMFTNPGKREALVALINETGGITGHPARLMTQGGEMVDVAVTAGCRRNRNSGRAESYQFILHDMRAVIAQTELETYRRTMGGLSDRLNNIAQVQLMELGLMLDYIDALKTAQDPERSDQLLARIREQAREVERSLRDLRHLGEKIRRIYHAPEPPVPVSDGTGGILFDLK
jgi:PAS domain S-box-containing protein